tara:strand:+ start:33659 stop:34639 length:981 start_codon:yes stop_codon:yes gene_type:complete
MKRTIAAVAAAYLACTCAASAKDMSLAYWMGPKHPMNAGLFEPFAEKLAEVSGGEMTVTQYPGGALNTAPPKQYSIMLSGVADVVFALPGYTSDLFPKTNVISFPGVCEDAVECTEALLRAKSELEDEYDAKLLAIWANDKPVLITRDTPVRTLEDLKGLKIRVATKESVSSVEAMGASAVAQPASVLNQNLANGVIDGIMIGASAIASFKLHEPGKYVTTWFPSSASALILAMNKGYYDSLSDQEKAWVDAAADESLSRAAGQAYQRAGENGLQVAADNGMELIEISDEEKARFNDAIADAMAASMQEKAGDKTVGEIMAIMKGE